MKVILKYTDAMQDGRNVFNTLAIRNVEILKTRQGMSIYPHITIRVKDTNELNQLVSALNRSCNYEVRVVKVNSEEGLLNKIKKIFK
jgi:hypothetical protein